MTEIRIAETEAEREAISPKVRVLALNDSGLRQLIESDSAVAARLLLYLSKCLCLRLRERSRGAHAPGPR